MAALLAGKLPEPPEPDLLQRIDGHRLLYRGQVNVLFGDPESGKTFVALAATVEALNAGRTALVLDLDHNGVEATVARLLMLGANRAALADLNRFRYCEPESALDIFEVVKDCKDWQPTVAVVDSIGELLPTLKADSNNADDFTRAHTNVLKPLARAGAAVIAIDHLAKNNDSRAKGPGGTAAKRRALGGTSLRVKATRPFSPGNGGTALLLVNKDRHGGVRRHAARPEHGSEQSAGTFVLATDYEVSTGLGPWRVLNPSRCDRDPDETADPADIALLNAADPPPRTAEDARKVLRCNKDRANRAYRVWREER
ncbi:AAA family ATPase [Mycobacterium sp. SMC-4]|uniref:AAA family ATPase n=1 Tax=Mycobacterium sp. SMC-4 TaxID=2857059 RepID=UPI0021B3C214|nr:AAA family ATPase [Mycobacterium sp. SMC-4]UXA19825.1 AAA family ATPase [Mycobacterium sp. SMC-4]